jgi:nucleoside-diphosphate-sugar epimerase
MGSCHQACKVLLTGATGFIGSHLAKRLTARGHTVFAVVRETSDIGQLQVMGDRTGICVYDGTVGSMVRIFTECRPDLVIHLAAYFVAEHKIRDIDKLYMSNILLGAHLLEAMAESGTSYLINAGTVWQHYNDEDYNPVNLYAATKKAFEDICRYYSQATGLRVMTLELSDTYGPNDKRPKVLSLFKKASQTGELLEMTAGQQLLGLVYIDDVIDAFLCAMEMILSKPEHYQESFTVIPEEIHSLREVAGIFENVSGKKLNILWGAKEYRLREVMKPYSGKRLPGWKARTGLHQGIAEILKE